ncbi:MAG TPA: BON domain-containing protein [Candidatus Polarisedimenticolaceae bacterium]|nr:BON domain-containing protein [Candidatus Polarisedimenticolaceae bacterium]
MRLGSGLTVLFSALVPILAAQTAPRSDVAISRDANLALRAAKGLDGSAILLETESGTVTLRGSVPSDKARTAAADTVRGVPGVVEVHDELSVLTPAVERAMRRSDAVLKRDIERGLKADQTLRYSRIVVQSVDQGVVVLGGDAASTRDETAALQAVTRRPGVRRVVSNVRVVAGVSTAPETSITDATVTESPLSETSYPIPSEPGTTVMDVAATPILDLPVTEDDEIRRQVQAAILDLDREENAGVVVTVRDGVVWLTGTVGTWDGNDARLHAARSIPGVRTIVNEVFLAPVVR